MSMSENQKTSKKLDIDLSSLGLSSLICVVSLFIQSCGKDDLNRQNQLKTETRSQSSGDEKIYTSGPLTQEKSRDVVLGEVLVTFKPGIVNLPAGITETSLDSTGINSRSVKTLCKSLGVTRFEKVVKSFVPGDTIGVHPITGKTYKKHDLSLMYKVSFSESLDVYSVVKKFEALQEVEHANPNAKIIENIEP